MPKWAKMIVGILLLPLCVGGARALWSILTQTGHAETIWVATLGGAACWWVIFLMLPKPMWIYVVGHELTHALWTWLFAGRVKKFKATSTGGHVVISKSNFLIVLAPYFFPLYAMLIVLAYLAGDALWGWSPYCVWFHFLLGGTYAFHVTLTWHILQTRQSDITQEGYLFSAVIIFLGNLTVLMTAVPLLAGKPGLPDAFQAWAWETWDLLKWVGARW